ncbi:MAG: sulfatase-like hydrolase/transferase [Clostridiales bacterium]|nr:sulfatase-like hydrolase/transferase [Clostridiales bacterium]
MLDKIKRIPALFLLMLKRIGQRLRKVFLKIFPRRAAKYFDADLHEVKYIFLMLLYAFVINLYIEWIARLTTGFFEGLLWMLRHPLIFSYNMLIIFCTMTLALLFKRRRFAWFMISLAWILIGTANGIIKLSRMTPFTLYDMQNLKDGLTIATTYYAIWTLVLIAAGIIAGIFAIVLIFLRSEKWRNIKYSKSISAILLTIIVTAGATYAGLQTGMIGSFFANLSYAYRDYGVPYCFIATSVNSGISKPQGYSEEMITKILKENTKKGTHTQLITENDSKEHPNIIVLQMESFTVAQDYNHISVDKDPTPVFNELSQNYTSGWFSVPACGAGTANTEFEVLTGISARYFGPGEYPYKGKLREQALESMAYVTKNHGYVTSALHNHRALFYNRNEVYANLGFDTFTSVEYMNDVSFTPTNWCKDEVLTKEIMDIMTSTKERDFMHVVSVEGHGQYPAEQVFKNPYTTVKAKNDETKWKYEYYLNECHEMDKFIGDLIDEIEKAGEPTVMLIYGDHIPALDVTEDIYDAPDLYSTRYVIWDNIGLKKTDKDIAAYQSGAELLEDAGLANEGIIFDYQQTTSSKNKQYQNQLEALAYDMMYGKEYVSQGKNLVKPTDMKMGHRQILIKDVIKIGNKYYIRGKNFTERSIISMDGKQLKTVYLSPTLLALNEKISIEDVNLLEVSQVDKSEDEVLTTVGANEEL